MYFNKKIWKFLLTNDEINKNTYLLPSKEGSRIWSLEYYDSKDL